MMSEKTFVLKVVSTLIAVGALFPSLASAACSGPSSVDIPYPGFVVNEGEAVGMHNAAINDTLTWSAAYEAEHIFYDTCSEYPATSVVRGAGSIVPGVSYSDQYGSYAVFDIPGVEGIGYIIRARGAVTDWMAVTDQEAVIRQIPAGTRDTALLFSIRLYAYGSPPPGNYSIPLTTLAQWGVKTSEGTTVQEIGWVPVSTQPTTLEVNTVSCLVTSQSNQVAILPSVDKIDFSGVGSTVPVSAPFQFSLDCPSTVSLHATMSDGVDPGNTSDVLTLAPESTATGVGVQIFRQGQATPIAFGPQSPMAGTINQWFVGTGASNYVVPMEARYIQTGDTITPGQVDALATITFSYQ